MPPEPFEPPLDVAEVAAAFPRYHEVNYSGIGGQSVVFSCVDAAGNIVALKIYGPNTKPLRIQREVQALGSINCVYIVRLHAHGQIRLRGSRHAYMVVDYINGTPLDKLGRLLNDDEIKQLLHDISLGVEALWAKRIVHRDIKPSNIMYAEDGRYIIIDLGIAKFLGRTTATTPGFTLGTNGFMSPEQQIGRRQLTFRSDLYSLGITAYLINSGHNPLHTSFTPLNELTGLSENICDLVMWMLSSDPFRRPCCKEVYEWCKE